MDINELLLTNFNNQETKYYDEGILESKILRLETYLIKCNNKDEIKSIYKKLKSHITELNEMQKLRLIKFILDKFN